MAESKAKKRSTSATKKKPAAKKKTATTKSRPSRSAKSAAASKKKESGTVTVDRRRSDRRTKNDPTATDAPKPERRAKVNRRRQIDPTTCERDYSNDEVEFMRALDEYKRANGRQFPTCSEILEVIRGLGYVKRPTTAIVAEPAAVDADSSESADADLPASVPFAIS